MHASDSSASSFQSPDRTLLTGLILWVVQLFLFVATSTTFRGDWDLFSGTFLVNYTLFCSYTIVLMRYNRRQYGRALRFGSLRHNLVWLFLFNLSAYSLNQTLTVFQDSTTWLCVFFALLHAAVLLFILFPKLTPGSVSYAAMVILGAGVVFNIYETIYCSPLYAITLFGFWFFGIALHSLVPALWVGMLCCLLYKKWRTDARYKAPAIAGMILPVLMVIFFTIRWNQVMHTIRTADAIESDLPAWVSSAQRIPDDWMTRRVLKSRLIYTTLRWEDDFTLFPNNMGNVSARREHDPFIAIASLLTDYPRFDLDTQLQLYKSIFGARHQTERRLWRGDNLVTDHVHTEVQLFPNERLAYMEKTIDIEFEAHEHTWRRQQEAVYSFYLPPGATVTSASLWIEGREEKAYLTTTAKADSAYTSIVGVEQRDPLLIHWQPGNRISLRVFPVRADLPRRFKVGFTIPLNHENDRLSLRNVDFEGPNWRDARETLRVFSHEPLPDVRVPFAWQVEANAWTFTGNYQSDWLLDLAAPKRSFSAFGYNGHTYQLQSYRMQAVPIQPERYYLDLSRAWTAAELRAVQAALTANEIYIYQHSEWVRLREDNFGELTRVSTDLNYSLFPFHQLPESGHSIVLTKSNALTPTLDDLKGSVFASGLQASLERFELPVRVLELGDTPSLYLQGWSDLRGVQLWKLPESSNLRDWLANPQFPAYPEDTQTVFLPESGLQITRVATSNLSTRSASDHLMRLYAYNDILRRVGQNYYEREKTYVTDELIETAKEAYVVSPVSSLIVLETQEDYDRFQIKASKNSLKNASIEQSGSVPEPHEWALILLTGLFVIYLWSTKKFPSANTSAQ